MFKNLWKDSSFLFFYWIVTAALSAFTYGTYVVKDIKNGAEQKAAYTECAVDKKTCTKEQFAKVAAYIESDKEKREEGPSSLLWAFMAAAVLAEKRYQRKTRELEKDAVVLEAENAELKPLMAELEPYVEADRKQKAEVAAKEELEELRRHTVLQKQIPVPKPLVFKRKK